VYVVKLEILARCDMEHAIGVLLGKFSQRLQLIRCDSAERDLDSLHSRRVPQRVRAFGHFRQKTELLGPNSVMPVSVIVALPVTASTEPGLCKELFIEPSSPPQRHLHFEDVDLFGNLGFHLVSELFFPGGHLGILPESTQVGQPGV
jgi:hypothetical protein